MFRFFLFVCLFISTQLLPLRGYAHHVVTDSLNNALTNHRPDSAKAVLYKLLVQEIRNTSPYKALDFAQQGLDLALQMRNYPLVADFYTEKGFIYHTQGNYAMALHYFLQALHIADKNHLLLQQAEAERKIALLYQKQQNFTQALAFAQQSLHTLEHLRDRQQVALALGCIADIYLAQNNHNKAIYYFNKALPILKTANEQQLLANMEIDLLEVYLQTANYPKALQFCDAAHKTYKALAHVKGEALALQTYGKIYAGMGNLNQSSQFFQQAIAIYLDLEDNLNETICLQQLATLYFDNKKITEAELYANQSLAIAKSLDARQEIKEAYQLLYQIYKQQGLLNKALYYFEQKTQMTDSIYNHEKDNFLVEMHHNYEKERHIEEVALHKSYAQKQTKEIEKQTNLRNLFIFSSLLALALLFFLWKSNHQKKAINQALLAQQALISAQNRELHQIRTSLEQEQNATSVLNTQLQQKIANNDEELQATVANLTVKNQDLAEFSHIVSHNLRSPISTIKGLLNLYQIEAQENQPEKLEQLLMHLSKSINKLDAVVYDLNEILAVKDSITQTNELIDFQTLTWEVLHTRLEYEINKPTIQIQTNFADNLYFVSIRSYVENIVYQLVSNAIKYQDPDKPLLIQLSSALAENNDEVKLAIKDNGLGIPDTNKLFKLYQRQHFHVEGTGLGLYLVAVQLQAMGGRIEVDSEQGHGTEFSVYFRLS